MDHADSHGEHNPIAHVMPTPILFGTFAILVALTFLTVYLGTQVTLGPWEIYVSLAIASFKAFLVAAFFMHLRYDKPLNGLMFVFSIVFLAIFLGAVMVDFSANQDEIQALDAAKEAEAISTASGGGTVDEEDMVRNTPEEEVLSIVASSKGSAAVGEALFVTKTCVGCHRQIGNMPPVGPALGGIAKRMSRREIAESILYPSKKISKGYEAYTVLTIDGVQHLGILVEGKESGDAKVRKADGTLVTIPEDEIDDLFESEKSQMPEKLVDTITPEQFAGLVTYLESL
ncbi:cytochrome C oxidase subunit IV family protein [Stratiformator vulcanicus]|uniref:Cytochrome c domain-containing protein n=1 Tax=Stratiformator vulcanicus TaxID=2527980 RepID=A0A517R251_9PLAN|nr:cytochrome C oxidase subunit IV family protein [Stratiformator vulcanicus]QDT37934.1 hypothetical protein Pan189_23170 [Stratiformator vulcanicus]